MKHSEKEDAALFLLESVRGQKIVDLQEDGKKTDMKKDGTLGRMLRGTLPLPEKYRLATANPEVVRGVVSYFRSGAGYQSASETGLAGFFPCPD